MEEIDLNQLYSQLASQAGNNEAYAQFVQSVRLVNEKQKQLNTRDRFLRAPLMTEQDKQEMIGLLNGIGAAAAPLLANAPEGAIKETVKKITALAAGENRAMHAYDPKKPDTLSNILEDARTLKVDLRGLKLKDKVSGNLNQRQPITFVDDKGREITGVFTKKKEFDIWNGFQAELDRIAAKMKNAEGRAMVSGLMNKLKQGCPALNIPPVTEENKNEALKAFCNSTIQGAMVSEDQIKASLSAIYAQELHGRRITKLVPDKVINEISDALVVHGSDILQGYGLAGMCNGTRVDTRNCAYSTVADMLGVPNVVARSRPMKVITAEGEVEGTFMKEAKGEDPRNFTEEAEHMTLASLKGATPVEKASIGKAIKDISDLQVLDFICGNVDRHDKNMFYSMSGEHKLCGVQGIDNDSDFGTAIPKNGKGIKEMTGLNDMRVISRSTYEKVMALTPESLKFALRGYGLSEKELDAAGIRLQMLQEKCRTATMGKPDESNNDSNQLYIVEDEQMKDLNFRKLCKGTPDGSPANLFAQVTAGFSSFRDDYHEQMQENPERTILRSEPADAANRAKITSRKEERSKSKLLNEALERRQDLNRPSSTYNELMKASKAYNDAQKALNDRIRYSRKSLENERKAAEYRAAVAENRPTPPLPEGIDPDYRADPDASYDAVITTGDLLELKELGKKLKDAANAYLEAGDDKGKNSKQRKQIAKTAKALGEHASNVSEEEFETAERNERRALDNTNRRVGNALEESGWQEGMENPLSADENVKHISVRDEPENGPILQ